jgi:tagatose 1,6-diphosphate aldolase GatY/KbaY
MQSSVKEMIEHAREGQYAVGAFNVYNLEGALAVIQAAEAEASPVILQLHPPSLHYGGGPLLAACLRAAQDASVPAAVHLDHCDQESEILFALANGIRSVMADGSKLNYAENTEFTHRIVALAHRQGCCVEAELGRLSGVEDDQYVTELDEKMTDPVTAAKFADATHVDLLAVCIGNAHGPYTREPQLDFVRLAAIRSEVSVPLVLHGASGLPRSLIQRSISSGVAKFNVNTELRCAYLATLRNSLAGDRSPDLLGTLKSAVDAMQRVVKEKLQLFGSSGKAINKPRLSDSSIA